MKIPDHLSHLRAEPGGVAWLAQLPELVRSCADEWSLQVGEPHEYAYVSLALRAELPDRTPVVLKVGFPHRESEHEGDALAHYDARGAVTLLEYDAERQHCCWSAASRARHCSTSRTRRRRTESPRGFSTGFGGPLLAVTRTSIAATSSAPSGSIGSRSTRSPFSQSASSTRPR